MSCVPPGDALGVKSASKCGSLICAFPIFVSSVFQHSCSPNLFVQNVFVDTHDLRFPWVAFFASK